jgi:hypothetical protein
MWFFPFFVFTYDVVPDFMTPVVAYRLIEMVFSYVHFWLIILLFLVISLMPLIFYYNAQALLFPSLKDLILQQKLDYD